MGGNVVPHGVGEKRPGSEVERGSETFGDFDEEKLGEIRGFLERIGGVKKIEKKRIEGERKQRGEMKMKKGKQRRKRWKHD